MKTIATGTLIKKPTLEKGKNDNPYCKFQIAVKRVYKAKGGSDICDIFDCIAVGATATELCKTSEKGKLLSVEGRFQTRVYKDKLNDTHKHYELFCSEVIYVVEVVGKE